MFLTNVNSFSTNTLKSVMIGKMNLLPAENFGDRINRLTGINSEVGL